MLLHAALRRPWSARELVTALRASRPLVDQVLNRFEAVGLIGRDGGLFRYAPASPDVDELCERLEAAYRERPVAVVNAIVRLHSTPGRSGVE